MRPKSCRCASPRVPSRIRMTLHRTTARKLDGERKAVEARLDGKVGFAKMKELAGEWTNKAEGQTVIYRVMSKGKSVMEILYAGTDHEMVTMYYLDGDDLVATHYCVQGNQPRLKLDTKDSRTSKLVFDFAGGTNLDPAKDTHMHAQPSRWWTRTV